jgi:hypothetical protein
MPVPEAGVKVVTGLGGEVFRYRSKAIIANRAKKPGTASR